ncbi:glycoside hydrolase family 26 protein [Spongisporangium articulatum]|uniref:Glycoside hydrolase family 26 protein n=1 Tax=Spongisporangium articulatum TaxID=3362603 RepID=A0ABW8APT2_9ACTN
MRRTRIRPTLVLLTALTVGMCAAAAGGSSLSTTAAPDRTATAGLPSSPRLSGAQVSTQSIADRDASAARLLVAGRNRSGLSWPSGAYVPGGSPHTYARFGAWRGHKLDVAVMWTARSNWSEITNPDWIYRTWSDMPVVKVIGVPPIPENGSATMSQCAAGAYDEQWKTFARTVKAAGMEYETIVRLGWEFNGDWYRWSAHSPSLFVRCWRQVVSAAESVAPGLRWDWSVNRGAGQSVSDARKAWPGSRYVDVVGVDSYDVWPGATSASAWNQQLNGAYGLNFWLRFAKAHGKKLSVPEWGVYPGTSHAGHNGGDNPYYIAKMTRFFRANAKYIAYEAYFNESASYYAGSLWGPVQNPRAARAYRAGL